MWPAYLRGALPQYQRQGATCDDQPHTARAWSPSTSDLELRADASRRRIARRRPDPHRRRRILPDAANGPTARRPAGDASMAPAAYAAAMLVGRTGLSPVMVGRAAELDRLARLLDRRGPPPPSPSSAARPASARPASCRSCSTGFRAGTVVLAGQADPGALGRPFELLLDAVDGRAESPDHADLLADGHRPAPAARRAGPQRRSPSSHALADGQPGRRRVRRPALGRLRERRPVRAPGRARRRPAAARRHLPPGRAQPPPPGRRAAAPPRAAPRRHPPPPRPPHADRRERVPRRRLRPRRRRSGSSRRCTPAPGGNPFFLEELLAAAGDADPDELVRPAAAVEPRPRSCAPSSTSSTPRSAASSRPRPCSGGKVAFDLLATVTRCTEDELIHVLRDLVDRRAAGRGRERRLQLPPRPRPRGDRGASCSAASAGGCTKPPSTRSRDAGERRPRRHRPPRARRRPLRRPGRRGPRRVGAATSSRARRYQALQLAELGLAEADDDLRAAVGRGPGRVARRASSTTPATTPTTGSQSPGARATSPPRPRRCASVVRLRWESGDVDGMDAVGRGRAGHDRPAPAGASTGPGRWP